MIASGGILPKVQTAAQQASAHPGTAPVIGSNGILQKVRRAAQQASAHPGTAPLIASGGILGKERKAAKQAVPANAVASSRAGHWRGPPSRSAQREE